MEDDDRLYLIKMLLGTLVTIVLNRGEKVDMGSMDDVRDRPKEERNTNREGPLKEIYALVDRDLAGNEVILQQAWPGSSGTQYLLCSDLRYKDMFFKLCKLLMGESKRNLRIVRLVVEEIEQ